MGLHANVYWPAGQVTFFEYPSCCLVKIFVHWHCWSLQISHKFNLPAMKNNMEDERLLCLVSIIKESWLWTQRTWYQCHTTKGFFSSLLLSTGLCPFCKYLAFYNAQYACNRRCPRCYQFWLNQGLVPRTLIIMIGWREVWRVDMVDVCRLLVKIPGDSHSIQGLKNGSIMVHNY